MSGAKARIIALLDDVDTNELPELFVLVTQQCFNAAVAREAVARLKLEDLSTFEDLDASLNTFRKPIANQGD